MPLRYQGLYGRPREAGRSRKKAVQPKALVGGPNKDTLLRKLSDLVERKVSIGAPVRPAAQ